MTQTEYYPGKKFSLPEYGSGSVAALWRRFLALSIDWGIAVLVSYAFFKYDPLVILLVFTGQRMLLQVLIGMSIGQVILGIRVSRVDGKVLGLAPVVRTLLILLVIPVIILDPDQRGLHDVVSKTIVLQR